MTAQPPAPATSEYPFLLVSITKLIVLSILTFNVYLVYWLYKNWKAVNQAENADYHALFRAVFAIFFIRSLARRMNVSNPTKILVCILIINILSALLPASWSLLSVFGFIPFVWMQQAVNAQHPATKINGSYSTKAIVFSVIGGLMWILVFIGLTIPA